MKTRLNRTRLAAAGLLALLALPATGCFNPFDPALATRGSNSRPAPLPNSPSGVVDLFQWCWQNRAYDEYQDIFTDNYRFEFASGDSAGTYYATTPWTRSDELATAQHIFITGTPSQPPATSVTLNFTQDLSIDPDPRDGKRDTTYHRQVTALVNLRVYFAESGFEVTGPVYFNVIRGDSAIIPPQLLARGFTHDPNRWYIERWVDGTLHTASAIPAPPGPYHALRDGALGPGAPPAIAWRSPGPAEVAPAGSSPIPRTPVYLVPTSWGAIKSLWGPR
jgi:hypothetical protein